MTSTLTDRVRGPVYEPGDHGFAAAAAGFNLSFTPRPDLLVTATSVDDIVEAVRFARSAGMRVSVMLETPVANRAFVESAMPDAAVLAEWMVEIAQTYATHPAFLKVDGRPVIQWSPSGSFWIAVQYDS